MKGRTGCKIIEPAAAAPTDGRLVAAATASPCRINFSFVAGVVMVANNVCDAKMDVTMRMNAL